VGDNAPVNARSARLPLVDSLRAIAALSVLLTHTAVSAGVSGNPHSVFSAYAQRLDVGVTIFFLISGLLLYRPFVRARALGERAPAAGPYAWRRLLRIVPAYWLALSVTALVIGRPASTHGVFTLPGGLWYLLLAQSYTLHTLVGGLTQAWTLTVEVAFYALIPAWAWLGRRSDRRSGDGWFVRELVGLLVLVVISVAWKAAVLSGQDPHQVVITPALDALPSFLDQFALGMGLAVLSVWLELRPAAPSWVARFDRMSLGIWLLAAMAFWAVSTQLGIDNRFRAPMSIVQYLEIHFLDAVVALALLAPAAIGDGRRGAVRKILAWPPLAWLGLISYGIYLWQAAAIAQLDRWHFGNHTVISPYVWWTAGTLAFSIVLAAASYYGLERPVLRRLRGRFDDRPGEALAAPVPVTPLSGAE
jgi:peptidoglycan/LPS O-acetylase OafA/YrhL